jgi:uncharacterized protein YggU (UPF0235/DUF167 family)
MKYTVVVKPGSSKGPLVVDDGGEVLTVYVRQRAVEGAANLAVTSVLAKHFGVSKSRVVLVRGHQSHTKLFDIDLTK